MVQNTYLNIEQYLNILTLFCEEGIEIYGLKEIGST